MRINADLTTPVIVHAGRLDWVASPSPGVDRRMLYREGGEVARATSIVRYAPGSAFSAHVHAGGEEILVIEGTFQDEHGDYPAGSYFRNPPDTSHTPAAAEGCVIFVRLWQFRRGDQAQVVRRPGEGEPAPRRDGVVKARILFDDGVERVQIEDWHPRAPVTVDNRRGLELLVVSGEIAIGDEVVAAPGWARLPAGQTLNAVAGAGGATVWFKDAALQHRDILAMPA